MNAPDPTTAPVSAEGLRERIAAILDDTTGLDDAVWAEVSPVLERLRRERIVERANASTDLYTEQSIANGWADELLQAKAEVERLRAELAAERRQSEISRIQLNEMSRDYERLEAERDALRRRLVAMEAIERGLNVDREGWRSRTESAEAERGRYRLAWQSARQRAQGLRDAHSFIGEQLDRFRDDNAGLHRALVAEMERAEKAEAERDALKTAIEDVKTCWPDPFGNWSAKEAHAARAVKEHMLRRLLAALDAPETTDRPKLITGNGMKRRPSEETTPIYEDPDDAPETPGDAETEDRP